MSHRSVLSGATGREGLYNDTTSVFNPTSTTAPGYGTNVPWAGVMSMVEINVGNLKKFLDGMLVPSKTPPRYEVVWPIGDDPLQISVIKGSLEHAFGVHSLEELRKRLDVPVEQMTRADGYLLVRLLWDYPTALRALMHEMAERGIAN